MNRLNKLLSSIRPITNAVGLNKLAKIPANTIGKHYRWQDGKDDGVQCPLRHGASIVAALSEIFSGSVNIGEWAVYYFSEDDSFITVKALSDEPECIETETGFRYKETQAREVYDRFALAYNFCKDNGYQKFRDNNGGEYYV